MKVWVPLLFLATVLAGCETGDPPPDGGGPLTAHQRLYFPFEDVTLPAGWDYIAWTQWAHDDARPNAIGLEWITDRSGVVTGTLLDPEVRLGNLTITRLADDDALRFGQDGYNATRVTLYAFVDTDELIAYRADLHEFARVPFLREEDPFPFNINDEVYYLGDADPAPNGTTPLPAFLEEFKPEIRNLTRGLPVGGAQTVIVPEEKWDAFTGGYFGSDLYLTARVDELVYAP